MGDKISAIGGQKSEGVNNIMEAWIKKQQEASGGAHMAFTNSIFTQAQTTNC